MWEPYICFAGDNEYDKNDGFIVSDEEEEDDEEEEKRQNSDGEKKKKKKKKRRKKYIYLFFPFLLSEISSFRKLTKHKC